MADENTTAATPATEAAPKVLTVIDDMDNRRLFDSADDAAAYIGKCQADYPDFNSYPVAAVGLTEEGDFDPEVYTDQMRIAVSVLTQRGEGVGSSTVKAIVIYPSPKINAILGISDEDWKVVVESNTGLDWLGGIIEKELNHVAVRQLRKAENADEIADAIQTMPTTIEAYTTSGRESSGGVLQTYNDLWQLIKKAIGAKSTPFRLANLSKKELRKGMESSAYALSVYSKLEDRENKKGEKESLFAIAAAYGQVLAKAKGLDPAIFDRMLATRNEKVIEASEDEDDGEFDFEAMAAAMAKPAETTPATEGAATDGEAPGTDSGDGDEPQDEATDDGDAGDDSTDEQSEGDAPTA
jgi:hypothetical protein